MEGLNKLPADFVSTFIRHVKMLGFIGINIFRPKDAGFLTKYGRFIFFTCFTTPMLVGQILYVMCSDRTGASFLEVVNAIPSTLMVLQDFVKMSVAASKSVRIREVIVEIGEVWPTGKIDAGKEEALGEWRKKLKMYDNAYFTCAIVALATFELVPLCVTIYSFSPEAGAQYEFPVQMYFFCWLTSHYQYGIAYAYFLVACTVIHMCIYISCDFLLVALTFDVSALLSLLQSDLKTVVGVCESTHELDDDCEDIKRIVVTHQKLLRLTRRLDDIFGAVIFTQVSFSSVVICCFGFLAVIAEGMLARHLTAACGIMFAVFILAWPGQILADTSFSIAEAAYDCLWYQKGVKFRKYIAILLSRSQNPCYLTALGFSNLNLAMFSKVLSTSWSYLSLLKQMYQDM